MPRWCYFEAIWEEWLFSLWYSWTTKCHVSMPAAWMLSKALLWGESGGHTLIFSHAATAAGFFLKALWPRKAMYGMNDAPTAESIERHQSIYTSRKEKMSTGQWLSTPWMGYAKIIWKKQKHSEGSIFVRKWGIRGEAIFPFPWSFQNSVCF